MKSYDKAFITGCDKNTEWMLEWFLQNYKKHNDTPIIVFDFGMTADMLDKLRMYKVDTLTLNTQKVGGWFYKPQAMLQSPAKQTCWIDTDIHVLGDISGVFDYVRPDMLSMVQDRPWSTRRKETWHNSGVVAFMDKPQILKDWARACENPHETGDQEVLHVMMTDPIKRLTYITDIPHKYNVLRLDLMDGYNNPNKLCMHWTGFKGKLQIKKLMYNEGMRI